MYIGVLIGAFYLVQSYWQIGEGFMWLVILMPSLLVFIILVNLGVFDFLIKCVDK